MIRSINVIFICSTFVLGIAFLPAHSAIDPAEQAMAPISEALDELLIKTQQVFVQRDDSVDAFHIQGVGAIWVGRISIAGSQSLSISINDWNKWFDNSGRRKNEGMPESDNQDLNKLKHLLEMDTERLNQMEQRVSIFKKELTQFVTQHWTPMKNLPGGESLHLIFMVADEEFLSKFGTSALKLQISIDDLLGHTGQAEQSIPASAFKFNP